MGAKRKVTGDLYKKFREINRKHRGDKTYRDRPPRASHRGKGTSYYTRARERSACAALRRVRKARWSSIVRHAHVDIDEKWFYTLNRKRKRKVDPEWAEGEARTRSPT